MPYFDQKQIKILKGSFTRIAALVGCTPEYVAMVVKSKRPCRAKTAKAVIEKAKEVLAVLTPADQNN